MNNEWLKVQGTVIFKKYDSAMKLIEEQTIKNMVVNDGLDFFAKKVVDLAIGYNSTMQLIDKIGIGTSNTAVAATQTALQGTPAATEHFIKQITNKVRVSTGAIVVETLFTSTEFNKNIREAALFANTGILNTTPTMIARVVIPGAGITKVSGDFMSVTWKLQFG